MRLKQPQLEFRWLFVIFLCICPEVCHGGVYLEREKSGLRYKTSDEGRHFVVGYPTTAKWVMTESKYGAEISITTFVPAATVRVQQPTNLVTFEGYKETVLEISKKKSGTVSVAKSQLPPDQGVGYAAIVRATKDVIVTVILTSSDALSDMYMVSPVESFDTTYNLFSLDYPTIILTLAGYDNTVLTYHFTQKGETWGAVCDNDGNICGNGRITHVTIHAHMYHLVTTLEKYTTPRTNRSMSVTGTKLKASKPVMVLVGNFMTFLGTDTFGVTPALSTKYWAKRYVVMVPDNGRPTYKLFVYAPSGASGIMYTLEKVTIEVESGPSKTNIMSKMITADGDGFFVLEMDKPVAAIIINSDSTGFILTLIPETLWPSYAFVRKPTKYTGLEYALHIITTKGTGPDIIYNNRKRNNWRWRTVYYSSNYPYSYVRLRWPDSSAAIIHPDPRNRLMCYVIGVKEKKTIGATMGKMYQYPSDEAEFPCQPSNLTIIPGDLVDNDCDGEFDEELLNGEDDDKDGFIDEDTTEERVDGGWGQWMPWYCDAKCGNKGHLKRRRPCDTPQSKNRGKYCEGSEVQSGEECKSMAKNCAAVCPLGKFSRDCSGTCPVGCLNRICKRATGSCFACKPGYQKSKYCQINVYHDEVSLNPLEKDGEDDKEKTLYERLLATSLSWLQGVIVIGVLAIIIASLYRYKRSRDRKKEEMKDVEDQERTVIFNTAEDAMPEDEGGDVD